MVYGKLRHGSSVSRLQAKARVKKLDKDWHKASLKKPAKEPKKGLRN